MSPLTPCKKDRILAVLVRLLCRASHVSGRVILNYDEEGGLAVSTSQLRTWHAIKPTVPSPEELLAVIEPLGFYVTYDEVQVDGKDQGYCTIHSPWEPVKHRSCGSVFYPPPKKSDSIK